MAIYDVYQHPRSGKYRAVKQGFCWPAFFFFILWAFSRRLYLLGLAMGGLFLSLLLAEVATGTLSFPVNYIATTIRLAAQTLLAWMANDILRWFLGKRGFELQESVSATWPSSAIKQHIEPANDEPGVARVSS